jgi:tetratricopeptide (TPR) repeat protein
MTERLELLKNILAQDPKNTLARYGLAMEYGKAGRLEDAVTEYRALVENNPDYAYAYFQGGQTLEKLGRTEEAREMYAHGVKAATRIGDQHARNELQAALDLLG